MKALLSSLLFSLSVTLPCLAEEALAEEPKHWADDRITPEQPFPAKVIGARVTWISTILLLQSLDKPYKYLEAHIPGQEDEKIVYGPKDADAVKREIEAVHKGAKEGAHGPWNLFVPGVDMHHFTWWTLYPVGRGFGDEDTVRKKWLHQQKQAKIPGQADARIHVHEPMLTLKGHYRQPDGRVKEHKFPVEIQLQPNGRFKGHYENWIEKRLDDGSSNMNFTKQSFEGSWLADGSTLQLRTDKKGPPLPIIFVADFNGLQVILSAP